MFPFEECQSDNDCSAGLSCGDGVCSIAVGGGKLITAPCQKIYGVPESEALSPNTFLLGTILPYSGALAAFGPAIDQGVEMAVEQINQAGGILGKKIGVLSCDSGTDPATAKKSAKHLAQVGVPAIVGPAASSLVVEVFSGVAHKAGMLVMSPAATSTDITYLADDGLVWRTTPSDAGQGAAIAAYLLAQPDVQKVGVVNRNDTYGNALEKEIRDAWCKAVGSSTCPDSYISRSYGDDSDPQAGQSAALASVSEFGPTIIVLIAFEKDGVAFLNLAANSEVQRFILTDGLKSETLLDKVTEADILCRAIGTNAASPSGPTHLAFTLDFEKRWSKTAGAYTAHAYDALFLLAYGIAASGKSPADLTGADIAKGLTRMSAGAATEVGKAGFQSTAQTLANNPNSSINFNGASGPLDFDNSTGEAKSSVEGWYFDLKSKSIESLGVIYDEEGNYTAPEIPSQECLVDSAGT
jgi:branched-chain amino acid transport system substrate-binding protein